MAIKPGWRRVLGITDGVFERLACHKGRHIRGCNLDLFTSLRIATGTASTMVHLEGAKTHQLHSITFFQALGNTIDDLFQSDFGLSFAQICFGCNCIDKLSFVHNISFMIGHLAPGHSIQKNTQAKALSAGLA